MFGSLGAPELLLVALIAILVFGTGRLADVGRGLGEAVRNFKQGLRDDEPEQGAGRPSKKKEEPVQ
jgi:sec-independent protein translocase protein TatA